MNAWSCPFFLSWCSLEQEHWALGACCIIQWIAVSFITSSPRWLKKNSLKNITNSLYTDMADHSMVFAIFSCFETLEFHIRFTTPWISNSFYVALIMLSVTLSSVKYFCKWGQSDSLIWKRLISFIHSFIYSHIPLLVTYIPCTKHLIILICGTQIVFCETWGNFF